MDLYKKKYGIYGYTEYSALIPAGNTRMRVDFTDGSMTVRGIVPATFSTSDEIVQALIESSPMYKKGKIKIIEKYKIGETYSSAESKAAKSSETSSTSTSETTSSKSYPYVVNSQQAKEVLRSAPYNVSLSELGSKADIQNKAKEIGVVFPNWN